MAMDLKTWKKDFFEKEKNTETPDIVAQRLVNVYRQLSVLGEASVPAFNKMLMDAGTPEVLVAMKGIPGGDELREYVDFVQNQEQVRQEEEQKEQNEDAGTERLLPKAEEISPLWDMMTPIYAGGGGASGGGVSTAQIYTLATRLNNAELSLLEAEYKKILAKVVQNNQQLMEIVSYLVIDSDIEKTQRNLKATLSKMNEVQQTQIREMTKMLTQSGQSVSEKNKRSITSLLETTLLTSTGTNVPQQQEKGEKNV